MHHGYLLKIHKMSDKDKTFINHAINDIISIVDQSDGNHGCVSLHDYARKFLELTEKDTSIPMKITKMYYLTNDKHDLYFGINGNNVTTNDVRYAAMFPDIETANIAKVWDLP